MIQKILHVLLIILIMLGITSIAIGLFVLFMTVEEDLSWQWLFL